jgi:hypothetical protein
MRIVVKIEAKHGYKNINIESRDIQEVIDLLKLIQVQGEED